MGIARVAVNGLNGVPTLYTTYYRAIEYIPSTRFTLSYVLVQPKSDAAVAGIKQKVAKLGYVALTKEEFNQSIADYYTYKTGVGTNILLMVVIAFIVGLSISGQTFYTFILENLEKFGALKAIGAKGPRAGLHDPVHGDFYGADRLWPGRRFRDADDHDRPIPAAQLRGDDHLLEPGAGLRHGRAHRRHIKLCRGAQGPQDRAFRHLQGVVKPDG